MIKLLTIVHTKLLEKHNYKNEKVKESKVICIN